MNQAVPDLGEAFRLLEIDPVRSAEICRAVLARADDPGARLMLAGALRLSGDAAGAHQIANALARKMPNWPGARFEVGLALAALGRGQEALAQLTPLQRAGPLPGLWRAIGDLHWQLNDHPAAEQAYLRHLNAQVVEPRLHEAVAAFQRGDQVSTEKALQAQLARFPGDVLAQRLLAELYSSQDRYAEAESLLRACLERAPGFALGRYGLAMILYADHRPHLALRELETLLEREPNRLEYLNLKADALGRTGAFEAAAGAYQALLAIHPNQGAAWVGYGHILRALGRRADAVEAYRRAIALSDGLGEAYWGLANLKTYTFADADVDSMRETAKRARPGPDRTSLLFALAKALEDHQAFEEAFAIYSAANAARRAQFPHDRAALTQSVHRAKATLNEDFFASRRSIGHASPEPIFIVGMPRSGSTLVEQILASHSAVEGTMELIDLMAIARRLGADGRYPENLAEMAGSDFTALAEEYLARTRIYRQTDAPHFIDKLPNNFTQVGLIQLILPKARIIDVRRHPLACCVSNFKQHWATGQNFAYDLADLGAYYRDYVALMAHFDEVLPGRVHRVIYEKLVAEPESETRALIAACGLPFEDACLRFYENKRAVLTPSSEQVRRPINQDGLESWKPFEPWLEPLKQALGSVLDAYPEAPKDL